ncbi:MAG TPA: ABC transporter permease, partial [Bryobacteraceae bacterium]|nr:ABC transporter permease [Bryobacteraceae bacterium]
MNDIRYSLRRLAKSPVFTITAIVTLALGIGMNTAVFSMVNAVMLRGLPYHDPGRLISLWEEFQGQGPGHFSGSPGPFAIIQAQRTSVSAGNLGDYENRARSLSGLSGIKNAPMNLTGNGTPERLQGQGVSLNFFRLLGISPSLGRGFLPEEGRPGSNFVVILSNELWRRRFGADPQILGQSLILDGNGYRIVGVLPPGFQSPSEFSNPQHIDFYVPAAFSAQQLAEHGDHDLSVIGRLTPGTSVQRAQQELDAISAALARQFPHTNSGVRAVIAPLRDDLTRSVRLPLLMLLGAVALAVLIACANVANLFLVRAISRRREISIRFA